MRRRNFLKVLMSSYFIFKNNLFANNKKIYKNENHETLCFIGIGGGGTNILDDISKLNTKNNFIHINTDIQSLMKKNQERIFFLITLLIKV